MKKNLFTILLAFLVVFGVNAQKANSFSASMTGKKIHTIGKIVKQNNQVPKGVIMSETFAAGLPAGWQNVDNGTTGFVWTFDNPGGRTINTTTSADGFAILDSDNNGQVGGENADLITSAIDCSGNTTVILSFEHYFYSGYGGAAEVFVSGDNGANWTSLEAWSATSTANAEVATYDITAFAAGQSQVMVKWNWQGDYSWYWAIDDVVVAEPEPHDLAATAISPTFVISGETVTPQVTIHNNGSSDEATWSVTLTDGGSYTSTKSDVSTINSGADLVVDMDDWAPADGNYTLTATVIVTDDVDNTNDEIVSNVSVAEINAYAYYMWGVSGAVVGPVKFNIDNPDYMISIADQSTENAIFAGDMVNDVWYGVTGGSGVTSGLYTIDMTTGARTEVVAALTNTFGDMTYDYSTSIMYGIASSILYTMNLTDGTQTEIGTIGTSVITLACNLSGDMYAVGTDGNLYSINKADAAETLVGATGVTDIGYVQAMSFDHNTGKLYWAQQGNVVYGGIYEVNVTTGVASLIGQAEGNAELAAFAFPYSAPDVTLSDLTVDAVTVPGFDPATMTYNVELAAGTTDVPTVVGTPTDANATAVTTNAAALPGASTVEVTAQDGSTTSTYTINFTVAIAINDIASKGISVYPNPSNGTFTVNVENNFNLEVLDITGKVINTQVLNGTNTVTINNAGVYFLRFSNNEGSVTQKVIVQ